MKDKIVNLGAVVMAAGMVMAGSVAQAVEIKLPVGWAACEQDSDCGAASFMCGPSVGVRVEHVSETQAKIRQVETSQVGCDGATFTTDYAVCKDKVCVPDYSRRRK